MTAKTKILAAAVALVAAGPAFAGSMAAPTMEAEVYSPPAPNAYQMPIMDEATWDGAYFGINAGSTSQDGIEGSGMDFGLHAGNLDMGSMVVGAEVGYNPLGQKLDGTAGDMNSAFTAKAKAGYDAGDFMPYATLGMKYANADLNGNSVSGTGMTYGVGVDYRMTDNVIVGGELSQAKFSDFGDTGTDVSQTSLAAKVSFKF
jgi:outer membrane immunogenic protein